MVPLSSIVVAVDGPSGSGKSSVSRGVAARLGLRYLDTGAMYRAVTWWMLRHGVDIESPETVAARAHKPELRMGTDPVAPTIAVDGGDVTGPIRSAPVTAAVSAVSAVPAVRDRLRTLQRKEIGAGGIVVEGRDIGTVVAPDAPLKVFLTAAPEERARRRASELSREVAAIHAELARRDAYDSARATAPLTMAPDAREVDATHLTLDEAIDVVVKLVREEAGL